MRRQKKTDVFDMIHQFQKNIQEQKPSFNEMSREVSMMKYKIRPVEGDISILNFKSPEFIEALWSLGKLDEFSRQYAEKINPEDENTFIRLIEEIRYRLQQDLNKANINPTLHLQPAQFVFEMEIYKERTKQMN